MEESEPLELVQEETFFESDELLSEGEPLFESDEQWDDVDGEGILLADPFEETDLFAAEDDFVSSDEIVGASVVNSGTCGDNLTWTLDSEGTLTISGTGEMEDYTYVDAPWTDYCNEILKVIINEGCTCLSSFSIYNMKQLTKLILPNSLKEIHRGAISVCDSIETIAIPRNVSVIQCESIFSCPKLKKLEYNAESCQFTTHYIANTNDEYQIAFCGMRNYFHPELRVQCESIKELIIGENVRYLDDHIIRGLGGVEALDYRAIECEFEEPGKVPYIKSLRNVKIGNKVKVIPPYFCFFNKYIEEIELPNSVEEIGFNAFTGCESLKNIKLSCNIRNLTVPSMKWNGYLVSDKLETAGPEGENHNIIIPVQERIPDYIFANCDCLKMVIIPQGVKTIGKGVFYGCDLLEDLYVPSSLEVIETSIRDKVTIHGNANSYAELYAKENGNKFVYYTTPDMPPSLVFKSINTAIAHSESIVSATYISDIQPSSIQWSVSDPELVSFGHYSVLDYRNDEGKLVWDISVPVVANKEGEYTITIDVDGKKANTKLIVTGTDEFNERIYHANYYIDNNASIVENLMFSASPCNELYRASIDGKLFSSAKAYQGFIDILAALDDPATLANLADTKKNIYQSMIFSIFKAHNELIISEYLEDERLQTVSDLTDCIITTIQTMYKIDISESYYWSMLTHDQKEKIFETVNEEFKGAEIAKKCIFYLDIAKDISSYCEYVCDCLELASLNESNKNLIYSLADYAEDPDMKLALNECKRIAELGEVYINDWIAGTTGETLVKETSKIVVHNMWDKFKEYYYTDNPWIALFELGFKGGKYVSEVLCKSGAISEKALYLEMIVNLEKLVKDIYNQKKNDYINNRNELNAEILMDSVSLLFSCFYDDCDCAKSFINNVKSTFVASLEGALQKKTSDLIDQIERMKLDAQQSFSAVSTVWIHSLSDVDMDLYEKIANAKITSISKCTIVLNRYNYKFTGNKVVPKYTVVYKGNNLTEYVDYYCTFENNIEIGTAHICFHGLGFFKGNEKIDFKISITGNDEPQPSPSPIPQISLNKLSAKIYTGEVESKFHTVKLKATLENMDGKVKFTSSDKGIAKVGKNNGKVTAVSKGKAVITATIVFNGKEYSAECKITVSKPSLKLEQKSISIKKGMQGFVNIEVLPKTDAKWVSLDEKIAKVSKNGMIKGKKKGTTKVTVSANGITKNIKVTVTK